MRLGLGSARAWRIVLGLLAILSLIAVVPLSLLAHQLDSGVIAAAIGVPCAAVGWLVTRRQPGNPIGWLFLVTGVFMFLSTAGGDYGYYVYRLGHHLPLAGAGLALAQFWGPSLLLFGADILLFPDGRLASRWWRSALRIYCVAFALLILATCVAIAGPWPRTRSVSMTTAAWQLSTSRPAGSTPSRARSPWCSSGCRWPSSPARR